jgi:hypothetical protein
MLKANIDRIRGAFNKSSTNFVPQLVDEDLQATYDRTVKEGNRLKNVCSIEGKQQLLELVRSTFKSIILAIGDNVFGVEHSIRSDVGGHVMGISTSINDLIESNLPQACRKYRDSSYYGTTPNYYNYERTTGTTYPYGKHLEKY